MIEDFERCYAAVRSRDPRFDGWFYVGVTSTGIYCRPSCPAVTPKAANVRFYASAAAAHTAGFRACRRCRPDTTPGSPQWDVRADLVGRAMRLIGDGVVDREGVEGLAARLGYSSRHVHRQLVAELGAGPLALARAQRAHTARTLIETTALPITDVAFAAGFASVRQFNDTVRAVFGAPPTALRRQADRAEAGGETVALRLAHRSPADLAGVLAHLRARAVPGVEEAAAPISGGRRADAGRAAHTRSLRLPHGFGVVTLSPVADAVRAVLRLDDLRDLATAVQRCRRLLDLDADPVAVDERLRADDALAPLVASRPGLRVAGSVDAFETTVRTVLGQQVSVAAARTLAGRLVTLAGTPLPRPLGAVTHAFPDAQSIAEADLAALGVPEARQRALRALADAVATGLLFLDAGVDRVAARAELERLPGIGPWTAEYAALRALGDPDAFPAGDLALRRAAPVLGLPSDRAALAERAGAWRPWRAYAAEHLWTLASARPSRAA